MACGDLFGADFPACEPEAGGGTVRRPRTDTLASVRIPHA